MPALASSVGPPRRALRAGRSWLSEPPAAKARAAGDPAAEATALAGGDPAADRDLEASRRRGPATAGAEILAFQIAMLEDDALVGRCLRGDCGRRAGGPRLARRPRPGNRRL